MNGSRSEFYPPRATWWSPLRSMWQPVGRFFSFHLEHISISPFQILPSLLIPGYAFRLSKWPWLGMVFMAAFVTCLAVYFVRLGFGISTWAYAILFGIHVSSVAYLFKFMVPYRSVFLRVGAALSASFLLAALVYLPLQNQISKYVLPMKRGNEVVLIKRFNLTPLQRGDWVAYRIKEAGGSGVRLQRGSAIEQILAAPGDKISFGETTFSINGKAFPRLQHMPISGDQVVPEKHWFAWPTFEVFRRGVPETAITPLVMANSLVNEKTLIGKPYSRWFWRKQLNHEPLPKS